MNSNKPLEANKHIKDYLNDYVESKNPQFSVMLNGLWGSGKTFFIKELIKNWSISKLKEGEFIELKPIYVSLYGLNSIDQVNIKIKEILSPLFHSRGVKLFKEIGAGFIKTTLQIDVKKIEFEIDLLTLFKNNNEKFKGKRLLIFDDLERSSINIEEILGYINDLVENNNCHVIVVADEEKMNITQNIKPNYKEIKEKTIGHTLQLVFSYEDIFTKIVNDLPENRSKQYLINEKELIHQIFKLSNYNNIRLIKRAIQSFCFIFNKISDNKVEEFKELNNFLLLTIVTFYLEINKADQNIHYFGFTEDYRMKKNFKKNEDESIDKKYKQLYALHNMSFKHFKFKELIFQYIINYEYQNLVDEIENELGTNNLKPKTPIENLDYWMYIDESTFRESIEKVCSDFFQNKNITDQNISKYAERLMYFNNLGYTIKSNKEIREQYIKMLNKLDLSPFFTDAQFFDDRFTNYFKVTLFENNSVFSKFIKDQQDALRKAKQNNTNNVLNELETALLSGDIIKFSRIYLSFLKSEGIYTHQLPIFNKIGHDKIVNAIKRLDNNSLSIFSYNLKIGHYPLEEYIELEKKETKLIIKKLNIYINELDAENYFVKISILKNLISILKR